MFQAQGKPNQLLKALNQFQEVQEKTLVKEPTLELSESNFRYFIRDLEMKLEEYIDQCLVN